MAPEQLAGGQVVAAADVWALGVTLFEALTGTLPFTARTAAGLLRATVRDHAASMARLAAGAPPALASLAAAMMTARRRRGPRMTELAASLRAIAS
jgi:eukaryotic-like serine/threonine-protein kinase